jgi:hypothetical protein
MAVVCPIVKAEASSGGATDLFGWSDSSGSVGTSPVSGSWPTIFRVSSLTALYAVETNPKMSSSAHSPIGFAHSLRSPRNLPIAGPVRCTASCWMSSSVIVTPKVVLISVWLMCFPSHELQMRARVSSTCRYRPHPRVIAEQ